MKPANFSLLRRLLWRLVPSMLLLFALGGTGAYVLARHYADHVYDSWLYDSAESLVVVIRGGEHGVVVDLPDPSRQLFVWDVQDTTYFKVEGARSGLVSGDAGVPSPPADAGHYEGGLIFDAAIAGQPVRVVALALPAKAYGEPVQVEVAETEGKRNALAREILLSLLLFQGVLIAFMSLAIWKSVVRALQPLSDIAQQLDEQDHLRLGPLPLATVPSEVQPLTRALNSLLARLEKNLAGQRRFIADAAHQLRTPLTGLQLHLEQAQSETDLDTLHRRIAKLRESTERTVRLSNQMLILSRAASDVAASQPFERVDLCTLVREAGNEWVPIALNKNIELSFIPASDKIEIFGNPMLLREALNNLIDNAVKYHPGGGAIVVAVTELPQLMLTVEDDGPGIPGHEREHVLKRFYRVQQTADGGAGLGLAIVNEIAQMHRAELEILPGASDTGTLIRLRFTK